VRVTVAANIECARARMGMIALLILLDMVERCHKHLLLRVQYLNGEGVG